MTVTGLHAASSSAITAAGGGRVLVVMTHRENQRNGPGVRKIGKRMLQRPREPRERCTCPQLLVVRRTGPAYKCKRRCYEAFSDPEKEAILTQFNSLANKEVQDVYLFGLISSRAVKRRRPRL